MSLRRSGFPKRVAALGVRVLRRLAPIVLCAAAAWAQSPEREATLARWREALELDLAREVVAEGAERVASGGQWAEDGEALALVARALALSGEEARARALLESARPSEATRGHVELERARLALERDDLREALGHLWDGARVRHPDLPESYLLLGRTRVRLGEPQQAVPWLEKFVAIEPLSPETPAAWHMLAQAALARRDLAAARACAERAERLGRWQAYYRARRLQVRENPDEPLPRLGLGQLWLEVEQPARAAEVLRELTERFPRFCQGWFALGEATRKLGELEAAHAHYGRALECDPELALARYNRAVIARLAGRDGEARADFERLVQGPSGEDPRLLGAHLELARILLRAGEREAAQARHAAYVERGGREALEPPRAGGD